MPVVGEPSATSSRVERLLIQHIIRKGEQVIFKDVDDGAGNKVSLTVAQFVDLDLSADNLKFNHPLYTQILTEAVAHSGQEGFRCEQYFIGHPDLEISRLATEMSVDPYQFILPQKAEPKSEEERRQQEEQAMEALRHQTKHLILDFRLEYVDNQLRQLMADIKTSANDPERMASLMGQYKDMQFLRNALAKELGGNIVV